jgi:hypothetical protein
MEYFVAMQAGDGDATIPEYPSKALLLIVVTPSGMVTLTNFPFTFPIFKT